MSATWDVIVIGAGPAGMAAAATLGEAGASTLLLDEQAEPGGQVYRAVERNSRNPRLGAVLGPDYAKGLALAARLRASGATLRFSTAIWRIDADRTVWTRSTGGIEQLHASALVLATGAMERPVPVEGWTLPGVMTIGALQIMLKSAALSPEGRLVLAGSGPLFYLFARQCVDAGVRELTLLDTAPAGNIWPALRYLPQALTGHGPRYLLKGMQLLIGLRRSGVTIHAGASALRIEGDGRAETVSFAAGGRRHRIACTLIGLHEGVIPHQQVTRSLGCAHDWDEAQRCFRPRRDAWGQSSTPGIYVVGDAAKIVGAEASVPDGEIAAIKILGDLGRLPAGARDARFREADRVRRAHLTARPFLDRLYRPREEVFAPDDGVIVCRCENIAAGQVREVVAEGCLGPNQAKAFLRCGMGPCQGRLCGPTVSEIIARSTGQSLAETGYYRIRPPLKPVTVGELAALAEAG